MFLMWLGEQITARGIGNGISLIIFAGIVAGLPHAIVQYARAWPPGRDLDRLILAVIVMVAGRRRASSSSWSGRSAGC